MGRMIDITGQKFNRLTAIKPVGRYNSGNVLWLCKCECGKTCEVESYLLRSGKQISCGCYPSERMAEMNTKHGGFGTRLYEIWRKMFRRCYGVNVACYSDYGGRGISVCDEWVDFSVFREWAMSHGYDDALTIDRIDVNGNYEPANCRWATAKQQANNRRNNHYVEYNGEKKTVSEWADGFRVDQRNLYYWLSKNDWNLGNALTAMGV